MSSFIECLFTSFLLYSWTKELANFAQTLSKHILEYLLSCLITNDEKKNSELKRDLRIPDT